MQPAIVEAVPAKAQTVASLQQSALTNVNGGRWETGLAWRPERCFTAAGYGPCDATPSVPAYDPIGSDYFYPLGFRVRDICAAAGGLLDQERVRRQVEATSSYQAARELWTGALTTASPVTIGADPPYVNPFLADGNGTTVTAPAGATTLERKLGYLEQEAMDAALGQQVFLHVPPQYTLALGSMIEKVGNVLYTQLGNVIVADAGYTGSGPAAPTDTDWVHATGPVALRFSPIELISDIAITLNRQTNKQEIWGDRLFAATYDPCTHLSLKLGL